MMEDRIREMEKRGQSRWYEDGLWELVLGVLFVLYGAYYAAVGLLDEGSTLSTVMSVGYIVVVPGGMLIASRVMRSLKARLTAPRTGYVSFKRTSKRRLWTIAVASGAVGATVAFAALIRTVYVPVLIGGVGLAVGLGVTGYRLRLPRFVVVGAVGLVASFALAVMTDDPEVAFATLFGSVGAALAISGGTVFARYLRAHPVADDEEPEPADDATGEQRQ